jgi:hypothetical protein
MPLPLIVLKLQIRVKNIKCIPQGQMQSLTHGKIPMGSGEERRKKDKK